MRIIKSILFPLYQKIFGGKGYNRKKYLPKKPWNPLHQKRKPASKRFPGKIESKSLDLLSSYSLEKGTELGNDIDSIDILEYLGYDIDYVKGKYPSKGESAVYGTLNTDRKFVEINQDVPFNNGISITAEKLGLRNSSDGSLSIRSIKGLQIVNGGQTVASIHRAKNRDKADLSQIEVQAKITVVEPGHHDDLVPFISRYSNLGIVASNRAISIHESGSIAASMRFRRQFST